MPKKLKIKRLQLDPATINSQAGNHAEVIRVVRHGSEEIEIEFKDEPTAGDVAAVRAFIEQRKFTVEMLEA